MLWPVFPQFRPSAPLSSGVRLRKVLFGGWLEHFSLASFLNMWPLLGWLFLQALPKALSLVFCQCVCSAFSQRGLCVGGVLG